MLYTPRINYQPDVGHDMDPFIGLEKLLDV